MIEFRSYTKPIMMKTLLFTFALILVGSLCIAQDNFTETRVKYQKIEKRAVSYNVPYSPDVVEKAFEHMMQEKGSKPEKSKGYIVYRNVHLQNGTDDIADVYMKVDRKNRKDPNSNVSMFALAPGSNPATVDTDDARMEGSKSFLTSMLPMMENTDHEFKMLDQQGKIADNEKKMRKLEDDYADYEKKVKTLQDRMENNKKERENLRATIESEKSTLEQMRMKEKASTN